MRRFAAPWQAGASARGSDARLPHASPDEPSRHDLLRANLRMVAALGATITYHEAARGIGLTPPHLIHSVTTLLEELMEEDAANGHPFIAALVVSRVGDGVPAPGFFEAATRLGRFTGEPWSTEAVAWHAAELALAHAFHALDPLPPPPARRRTSMIDPVALTADLIRCPSVTPAEGGAITLLDALLGGAGFRTARVDRGGVANLFARWGTTGPVLGFNGHTDVVPPGDVAAWTHPPFAAEIVDGTLYGRGAADMKSGVAAFVAAAVEFVATTPPAGSVILTITGDEEGDATDGTRALLDWMADNGERMDHCLVGEPTCPAVMGEMIKIGRRGSMTASLTAYGTQGHTAYPAPREQPPAGAGPPARPARLAPAGRRHGAFRPVDAGDHHASTPAIRPIT